MPGATKERSHLTHLTAPVHTVVLPTHTISLLDEAVERAAGLLRAGQVVAIPTETVYGLAANAFDPTAVRRVFEVKGRSERNPLIVHVASLELARQCASEWPDQARQVADAFWPGPLTIVLPRSGRIPDVVTAGGPTVAIRWPRHPFVQRLVTACGFPLAAPSANLSGEVSPTTASHVLRSLGGKISLIIDGGSANVGIESTVLDLTSAPARVLRPGMIHAESLSAVLRQPVQDYSSATTRGELRSPGLLEKHYAPKARLISLAWRDDADLADALSRMRVAAASTHILAHSRVPSATGYARVSVVPNDPAAFARALYAELHQADELGAGVIVVEAVPDTSEWRGIADRLRRAGQ
jgi:L-threonylcarbamoyladenylate synthase